MKVMNHPIDLGPGLAGWLTGSGSVVASLPTGNKEGLEKQRSGSMGFEYLALISQLEIGEGIQFCVCVWAT